MKKMSVNTIVNLVAAIVLVVSLIMIEVSFGTAQGWFDTNYNPLILFLAILGILLLLAVAGLNIAGIGKENGVVSLLKLFFSVGACACAGVIFGLVMGAIATEFAYTFFSDFNKGTPKEHFMPAACTQAVLGMILCLVTIVAAAAANAFDEQRK